MSVWIVVVAAGSGARFGGAKQYEPLGAGRVIDRSLATARRHADGVVLVVAAADAARLALEFRDDAKVVVVEGGDTRSESVRRGLQRVPDEIDTIVVHDGARPLASDAVFAAVVAAVEAGADAAVPAIAVSDTLRRVGGGTVDRTDLVAVQTPQAFVAAALRRAHATGAGATDDAALVEAIGGKVVIVPGESINFKITTRGDLAIARALVAQEAGA